MKNNIKGFVLGVLVSTIGLTTVFAAPLTKQLNAVYSINAVTVDGKTIQFTDDSMPFTVDGRTFLPVRAISEALNKDVSFDSETATVIITSKDSSNVTSQKTTDDFVYLTKDMVTGSPQGLSIWRVREWDTSLKDNSGRTYETGVLFATQLYDADYKLKSDVYHTETAIDIGLLGEYSRLKGRLVLTENSKSLYNEYNISILADGREIKKIENVKTGTVPVELDFDISNVRKLTFRFESITSNIISETVQYGIVDVKLYK